MGRVVAFVLLTAAAVLPGCTDECAVGTTSCSAANGIRTCYDGVWSPVELCPIGDRCADVDGVDQCVAAEYIEDPRW